MDIDVTPEVGPEELRALVRTLEHAALQPTAVAPYESAWRRAGLWEAVSGDDDPDLGYALSPRSTRGATRA